MDYKTTLLLSDTSQLFDIEPMNYMNWLEMLHQATTERRQSIMHNDSISRNTND